MCILVSAGSVSISVKWDFSTGLLLVVGNKGDSSCF